MKSQLVNIHLHFWSSATMPKLESLLRMLYIKNPQEYGLSWLKYDQKSSIILLRNQTKYMYHIRQQTTKTLIKEVIEQIRFDYKMNRKSFWIWVWLNYQLITTTTEMLKINSFMNIDPHSARFLSSDSGDVENLGSVCRYFIDSICEVQNATRRC